MKRKHEKYRNLISQNTPENVLFNLTVSQELFKVWKKGNKKITAKDTRSELKINSKYFFSKVEKMYKGKRFCFF